MKFVSFQKGLIMTELYKLPDGWEWKKLGELCNFIRGPFGGSLKKQIFKESGNAVYEQSHAIYNQFEQIRYFIDDEKFEEMKRFKLRPNSLIMSCSGTIGKVAIVPNKIKKGIINQALLMLTPNDELNNIFLKLMIESNFFQTLLSENSTGAAIANVASVKVLKEIKIPLPPLSEQKRIVSKLDKLFDKIDKGVALHQKNMDEANLFMGSVLNDVFGELEEKYGLTILSTVVKINSGIALPKIFKDKEFSDGEYEFFKVAQMNNDKKVMKNANLNFTKEEQINNKIKLFPKGSILLPKRGGAILTNKKRILSRNASYDSNIMGLKANNERLLDEFLFTFLNSIDLSNYIDTTTIPQVNNKHIDMMNIPIPPLNIQQKVVKYLDEISEKIEKLKNVQKEKMESLRALKASILDKAFRGEL